MGFKTKLSLEYTERPRKKKSQRLCGAINLTCPQTDHVIKLLQKFSRRRGSMITKRFANSRFRSCYASVLLRRLHNKHNCSEVGLDPRLCTTVALWCIPKGSVIMRRYRGRSLIGGPIQISCFLMTYERSRTNFKAVSLDKK